MKTLPAGCNLWVPTSNVSTRELATAALVAVLLCGPASLPAYAGQVADDDQPLGATSIQFVPEAGTRVEWNGRSYSGLVTVTAKSDGMALVEETTIEHYLEGIREVPFEWPEAALESQAVAARTYLAWTLDRGRSSNGRAYGYDICATTACQVYAGVPSDAGSDRWRAAVAATDQEILLYQGAPAQALYSSTSGGRTRSVEDVFIGSPPLPYLVGVESDAEDSPFVNWGFDVSAGQLMQILNAAGVSVGVPYDVRVQQTEDGEGPWMVVVAGTERERRFDSWEFRVIMNRHAGDLFPDVFPADRPDGPRYPQVMLSPTYEITRRIDSIATPFGDLPILLRFSIAGNGWGHLVGLSQYGAKALADEGEDYTSILEHFYGGLTPQRSEDVLPETVFVGLATRADAATITGDGPITVFVDGVPVAEEIEGTWDLTQVGARIQAVPPAAYGVRPELASDAVPITIAEPLATVTVTGEIDDPAEVRLVVYRGGVPVERYPWTPAAVGTVTLTWSGTVSDRLVTGQFAVVGEVRKADGTFEVLTDVDVTYQVPLLAGLQSMGT